jgi:hypothetical protein
VTVPRWFARFAGFPVNVPYIQEILQQFEAISLAEMDGVKLQDRVDTKYVLSTSELADVLLRMRKDYRLLEVDGERGTSYRSLYFDTPDLKNYQDHHNRRTFRSKVRFREYLGSGLAYLEVKRKTGRGRTDKKRIRVDAIPEQLTPDQFKFITRSRGVPGHMVPTLWNHFTRYTFVNRHTPERLTMDLDLRFTDAATNQKLEGIVVAELKQERADRTSPFVRIMRSLNIRPSGMSKYCIGILMMGRAVKHNGFKDVLLKLHRLGSMANKENPVLAR